MAYGYEEKILEIYDNVVKEFIEPAKKAGMKTFEYINGKGRGQFDRKIEKAMRKFYKKLAQAEKWKFIQSLESENFNDLASKLDSELRGLARES